MPTPKKEEAAKPSEPERYVATTALDYRTTHVERGELAEGLPADSVKLLLTRGWIVPEGDELPPDPAPTSVVRHARYLPVPDDEETA